MKASDAKQIPLTSLLTSLGYKPQYDRKRGNELWYLSPLHEEKTPSFKVTCSKNTWYDFGLVEGGTIIDFVMQHRNTDVSGALSYLSSQWNNTPLSSFSHQQPSKKIEPLADREIVKTIPIEHNALIEYLGKDRKINTSVARRMSGSRNSFLSEIHYLHDGKPYFAIGLQNNEGGYELRSRVFKGGIGRKSITTIEETDMKVLHLFEGFMDWLSLLTIVDRDYLPGTTIILNSTIYLDQAIAFIQDNNFDEVRAYLDNDPAGQKAFEKLTVGLPQQYIIDKREKYQGYNDLNDYLQSIA